MFKIYCLLHLNKKINRIAVTAYEYTDSNNNSCFSAALVFLNGRYNEMLHFPVIFPVIFRTFNYLSVLVHNIPFFYSDVPSIRKLINQ